MKAKSRCLGVILAIIIPGLISQVQALEILHFVEAGDYAEVFEDAAGLKLTDDGVVLVSSQEKGTVLRITDGNIAANSLTPSIFKDPELGGIEVLSDNRLVVANQDMGQIAILHPDLSRTVVFSQSGSNPGELNDPGPLATSVNNRIYVGDVQNRRISVFNHQGLYLFEFGRHGAADDLRRPAHVSIDAEENVYVLEGTDRLSIFDVHGNLISRIKSSDLKDLFGATPEFSAMTTDLNGTLYLGDRVSNRISIYDWRKHEVTGVFGVFGKARSQFRDITYLSVNAVGQLAVLDRSNQKVEVYQLDPTRFKTPVVRDTLELSARFKVSCKAVYAFIEQQTLCISSEDRGILILSPAGEELGTFAEQAQSPAAIHVGDQSVAVLDKNYLHAFTHGGKHLFTIGRYGSAAGDFKQPVDVFIQGGLYYVADKGNNRVQVFAADGKFLEEIKSQQGNEKLFIEVGPIAIDSQKNLYVADGGALGVINVISKDRKPVTTIGSQQAPVNQVNRFYGLDVDRQNRLYALAGTAYNEFSVRVYQDHRLQQVFGAEGENGTLVYFDQASSVSVASGTTNSVYVNDVSLQQSFRFDLLEYPDSAFGLRVSGNEETIDLRWSSSKSPLIAKYEVQGAVEKGGPYRNLATSYRLNQSLWVSTAGQYSWFRVVSVSAHGLSAAPSASKENYFKRIVELYQAQELEATVELSDQLLRLAPDNAAARNILGMSLYQLKDYPRAITEFKQLEGVDAYHDEAIRHQVLALYHLEKYLEARALVNQVIEQSPDEIEPYVICTRISLKLADAIGAVSCAEDGLALDQSNVELRYLLGRAYIEAGLEDKGLSVYQTLVRMFPEHYEIRLKIAQDMVNLGRYDEALVQYAAVAREQPGSGAAAVGQARTLLRLDRDDEVRAIALKLSGKKDTKGDGHYLLGKIAARQGSHQEAVLHLSRAGNEIPEVADVWASLAQAYVAIGQPSKAVGALGLGIKHNPAAFDLYLQAGKIELDRQQYPAANIYLEKAVMLEPGSLQAQALYARGLFASRNYRSAALHAEAAARIAPEDIDVLVLQADIVNQQGKTGSAIEILKTAISLNAGSAELQYQIGRVYQDANLFDESQFHLERAAAIEPAWAKPHIALGNLHSKRRAFDDAVAEYEIAVQLDPSEENRAMLNVAFADRKKSLEFANNAPQLLLSDLNLQKVFSAAYKKYQNQSIGSVTLQNVSATDYGNLKLSFQIKEFMDFPTSVDIPVIRGGEIKDVPINATFNNKILEVDEDTGVQVEVRLTYLRDGRKDDISLTQPMTIYGKNAIIWGDSSMVGSFVTPKDDTLRDYVRQLINTYQPDPGPLNNNLVAAMVYFSGLTAGGTNYIVDPNTPFTDLRDDQIDYVQFPRETLRLKSGDCDDLSVLISAGLENLGIRTALVEIPGHLFLIFDTGLAAENAGLISQDNSLLVIRDGNVWIPLEATMVNNSFVEAWAEGANKYQIALAANELDVIDLQQAWQEYKPVTLRKAGYTIELPDKTRTENLVRQALNVLLEKSVDRLILPYQTMVTNDPANIGARLQIAILYARYGLYDDAEIAFEALEELAPENSAVITNRGNLFFLQKEYNRAIEYYSEAARLDSEDGGIWINLSMAQYKAGELKQARSSYQRALELEAGLAKENEAYSKLLSQ